MNTTVRAKFRCESVQTNPDGKVITLRPVVGGSSENDTFYRYTPWGEIKLGTVNASAADRFVEGADYYVDFTPTA